MVRTNSTDCTKALRWRDPHVIIPSTLACPFFVMYLEVSLSTFSFCVSNTYWWRTDPVDNDVIYYYLVLFPIPPVIEGNHQSLECSSWVSTFIYLDIIISCLLPHGYDLNIGVREDVCTKRRKSAFSQGFIWDVL